MAKLSRGEAEILMLLLDGEGYGLQLVEASGGRVRRGSVYVMLGRLEEKGFVVARSEPRPVTEGGLPRKLYRLTDAGRTAVAEWERDIAALLARRLVRT